VNRKFCTIVARSSDHVLIAHTPHT